MEVLKKIWKWVIENPWALLVALGGVFAAYLIFKRKDNKISSLQDAVAVQSTLKQMASAEAKAEVLKQKADEHEENIKKLDAQVAASKRRVVEIHEGESLEGKSDDEIAKLFSATNL